MSGYEGSKGSTTACVAGATGYTGSTGAQGDTGSQGNTGVAGIVGSWTSYRDYLFTTDSTQVQASDATKSAGIAAYLKANPSLQLGLDGRSERNANDSRSQELSARRVEAVRTALINAGVPSAKIRVGSFGDANTRRDGRVEVLFATAK